MLSKSSFSKKARVLYWVIILSIISPFIIHCNCYAFGEGAAVYNNAAINVGVGWTDLTFNSEYQDDEDYHSTSSNTGRLTVPYDGWYIVSLQVYFTGVTAGRYGSRIVWYSGAGNALIAHEMCYFAAADYSCPAMALWYMEAGDYVLGGVYASSAVTIAAGTYYTPQFRAVRLGYSLSDFNFHHATHENGGQDAIDVSGLRGILMDSQDAGWLQGYPITTSAPTTDYGLIWNGSYWEPAQISTTGGYSMPDTITATISGTVPVIISSTWQITETLSSGHEIAILRSFTYGEASIAIGLFIVAAMLGLNFVLAIQRR